MSPEQSSAKNAHCPLCGQAIAEFTGIKVDISNNVLLIHDRIIHLAPREAELMAILVEHMPKSVARSLLMARIFPREDKTENNISVWVHRLRTKLQGTGLDIITQWGRGVVVRYHRKEASNG